jgi:radical SAM superfamily enzyme YgiQ (UPF0313 family)
LNVLLIKPINDFGSRHMPLGLLHIGTVLEKAGYGVKIVDATVDQNYKGVIAGEVQNALLVGITCLTTEIRSAIDISDYVKSISNAPIIWGGWHPTLLPEQTCSDKSVDFVCIGEGEDMIVKLADALRNGAHLEGIEGLGYKAGPHVKVNPRRDYVNLEELPPINYDLIDVSKYVVTDRMSGRRAIASSQAEDAPIAADSALTWSEETKDTARKLQRRWLRKSEHWFVSTTLTSSFLKTQTSLSI